MCICPCKRPDHSGFFVCLSHYFDKSLTKAYHFIEKGGFSCLNGMGYLQQLGRSLMLPTMALPIAAVMLFAGSMPWNVIHASQVGSLLTFAGHTIFLYLPFLFAVGVSLGLTGSSGIAGMSALIGYFIYTETMNHELGDLYHPSNIGGIVIGIASALIYQRCKGIKLPEYIQFFGGSRMVPGIMAVVSFIVSLVEVEIYPSLANGLQAAGDWMIGLGGFGAFLYGTFHRLLVPFGLHHLLNNVYYFGIGSYTDSSGNVFYGDLPRFFAGDPTAGVYMAGLYPIVMFALPAIAFAIIHEAREDLKAKIKATFLTAALSAFLTGVTEPIEFAFLFVAPYLFVVHALLSGVSMWIAYLLKVHHGYAFSAGAIDFIVNMHLATNGWLLLPIGLVFGVLYYFLFRWVIRRFDLPTPGREEGSQLEEWAGDIPYRAPLIVQALGGKDNIKTIEACITRLRLTLSQDRLIDMTALRHLGAAGVIRLGGGNVQVVFGTYSEMIREEIAKVLRKDIQTVVFHSPVVGSMIPIDKVPDPIFAQKLVGDGVAFFPEKGELVAPVSGKIMHVYPTMHALGILTEEGLEVLLHIGIDTARITGKCFTALVKEGDQIEAGQLLVKFDLNKVKKFSKSLATPMIITNPDRVKIWSFAPFKTVKKGQISVMSVTLKQRVETGGDAS
jgi:glucose-specific phosphotransferase system IIA component